MTDGRIADVHKAVEDEIKRINEFCGRNELPLLQVPSPATIKAQIKAKLTPTEIMVAKLGLRETKRKLGKGSTDIR